MVTWSCCARDGVIINTHHTQRLDNYAYLRRDAAAKADGQHRRSTPHPQPTVTDAALHSHTDGVYSLEAREGVDT